MTGNATVNASQLLLDGGITKLNGAAAVTSNTQVVVSGGTLDINATASIGGPVNLDVENGGAINVGGTLDMVADNVNIFDLGSGFVHVLAGGTLTRTAAGTDGRDQRRDRQRRDRSGRRRQDRVHRLGALAQTGGLTDVKSNELLGTVFLQGGTLKGTGTFGGR